MGNIARAPVTAGHRRTNCRMAVAGLCRYSLGLRATLSRTALKQTPTWRCVSVLTTCVVKPLQEDTNLRQPTKLISINQVKIVQGSFVRRVPCRFKGHSLHNNNPKKSQDANTISQLSYYY